RLHLDSIDLFRGAAALMVFLHHGYGFFWRTTIDADSTPGAGPAGRLDALVHQFGVVGTAGWALAWPCFAGVNLFFIISGFCIHLPYAAAGRRPATLPYAARRLLRLYPTYLLVLGLGFAMVAAKHGVGHGPATLGNLIGNLAFWYYNGPAGLASPAPLAPVLWTIALEVQFYALYLLAWPLLRRYGMLRVTAAWMAVDVVAHAAGYGALAAGLRLPGPLHPIGFAPARFGEWLLGAWLAESLVRPAAGTDGAAGGGRWLSVAAGAACLVAGTTAPWVFRWDRYVTDPLVSFGFFLVVRAAVAREQVTGDARRAGSRPPVARRALGAVGLRCYSLYLFHFSLIVGVGELYVRLRHYPDGTKDALGGSAEWAVVTLVGVAVVVVAVEAICRGVEWPSHRLARAVGRHLEARARPAA
ncbi:MAG: acyltransferase 3, partial [Phycisphaerales bacterium]|nr:acyltransferase 3 [Phycisphaerales bacterium]